LRDWNGARKVTPARASSSRTRGDQYPPVPDPDRPGRRAELVDHRQVADVRRGEVERDDHPGGGGPGVQPEPVHQAPAGVVPAVPGVPSEPPCEPGPAEGAGVDRQTVDQPHQLAVGELLSSTARVLG
jgi:hypothetical protein